MGHHISAIIARAPADLSAAKTLELPLINAAPFVIVPLDPNHSDHWTEQLEIGYIAHSAMIFDSEITLEFARRLQLFEFALIDTDYFGGKGTQFATCYRNNMRVMPVEENGINKALQYIGVQRTNDKDEFKTLGLDRQRDFSELFPSYDQD